MQSHCMYFTCIISLTVLTSTNSSFQFIFSQMGNNISLRSSELTGKVILPDGRIHEFQNTLTVAELMLEYPQQAVIELNKSSLSAKRQTPLPADEKLEVKKIYLMVPMRRGKTLALSSEEAHRILLRVSSILRSRSVVASSKCLPLFGRICPAGGEDDLRFMAAKREKMVIGERLLGELEEEKKGELDPFEGLHERPEYLSRQLSGRGWKPSLDTINEKKASHWLLLARKFGSKIY
ncbi:hypothetical protein Ancab_020329 [Ancistrocladus abbreviatus]